MKSLHWINETAPLLLFAVVAIGAMVAALRHAYRRGWDDRGRALAARVLVETRHKTSERV